MTLAPLATPSHLAPAGEDFPLASGMPAYPRQSPRQFVPSNVSLTVSPTGLPARPIDQFVPGALPSASLGSGLALDRPVWSPVPAHTAPPVDANVMSPAMPMRAPVSRVLRVPRALLDLMTEAASAVGVSEQEVWTEAARLWLREHSVSDEPPPGAPALANPRRARTWATIDALLTDLRQPCVGRTEPAARRNGSAAKVPRSGL